MGKILKILIFSVVFILTVEAGYFWGQNVCSKSKKCPVSTTAVQQVPSLPAVSPQDSAIANDFLSPFLVSWLEGAGDEDIYFAQWNGSVNGTLEQINPDSVTIKLTTGAKKRFETPAEITTYSVLKLPSQDRQTSTIEGFGPGDNVGVEATLDIKGGRVQNINILKITQ